MRPLIDYPGSLHDAIGNFLLKLGDYGNFYWQATGIIFTFVIVFLAWANIAGVPGPMKGYNKFLNSKAFFLSVILLGILALRLPNLVLFQQNPDESEWMAGAATLFQDPRYWVSVHGGNTGPLVIYPLMLIIALGGAINYATARLFGLLFCILPSVVFIYFAFINLFNDKIARIIILPLAVCLAFASGNDMLAYESEQVPLMLISLALFMYSKIVYPSARRPLYLFLLGLALGCIPFAKLQAAPIALGIAIFCVISIIIERKNFLPRELFYLGAACLLPTLIVLAYVSLTDIFYDFWQTFIVFSLGYAKTGLGGRGQGWLEKLWLLPGDVFSVLDLKLYFMGLFLSSCIALGMASKIYRNLSSAHRRLSILSFIVILTALYGIFKPGAFYAHYLVLGVVPMIFFAGTMAGILYACDENNGLGPKQQFRDFLKALVFMGVIVPALFGIKWGSRGIQFVATHGIAAPKSEVARKITAYAKANEKMAIWGWMNNYYVETGLLIAAREAHTGAAMLDSVVNQLYFLRHFAQELEKRKPEIFLDAVAKKSFFFYDEKYRHENFPAVRRVVDKYYTQVGDFGGVRVFVRNDRLKGINAGKEARQAWAY